MTDASIFWRFQFSVWVVITAVMMFLSGCGEDDSQPENRNNTPAYTRSEWFYTENDGKEFSCLWVSGDRSGGLWCYQQGED